MWGHILAILVALIVASIVFAYIKGKYYLNLAVQKLTNTNYCHKYPKSAPCSLWSFKECTNNKYDSKDEALLSLGHLFNEVVELGNKAPDVYTKINEYWIPINHERTPIAHLYTLNDKTIIVIRGTDEDITGEWKLDSKFGQVDYVNGTKVSAGFLKTYNYFRDKLLNDVKTKTPAKEIYIVGHSLGSGIAAILTADYLTNLPNSTIYTFAMAPPRAGNINLANYIKNHPNLGWYVSLINMADIVPFSPPSLMYAWSTKNIDDYSHIGEINIYHNNYNSLLLNHSASQYVYALNNGKCGKFISIDQTL